EEIATRFANGIPGNSDREFAALQRDNQFTLDPRPSCAKREARLRVRNLCRAGQSDVVLDFEPLQRTPHHFHLDETRSQVQLGSLVEELDATLPGVFRQRKRKSATVVFEPDRFV